jgi:hypothetical protein
MNNIVKDFHKEFKMIGLQLNTNKSIRIVDEHIYDIQKQQYTNVQTIQEGTDILGAYIGLRNKQREYMMPIVDDYTTILKLISTLPASIAYQLIETCINARPVFHARIMPTWTTEDSLQLFDTRIDEILHTIITGEKTNLPEHAKLIRRTQLKRGGLGITRMKDIAEIAYIASLCESLHRIPTRYPEIINIYSQLKTYQLLDKEMVYIMKHMPQILIEDQSNLVS